MATYEPPNRFSKALAEVREKYTGAFNTGILCICGKGNIVDHATERYTKEPLTPHTVIGPGASHQEILDRFLVEHSYWCEECGVPRVKSVVRGALGYRTLEEREPIPRSQDVRLPPLGKKLKGEIEKALKKHVEVPK